MTVHDLQDQVGTFLNVYLDTYSIDNLVMNCNS